MGEVKRVVSGLMRMLDKGQKEAESIADTMHQLQAYLMEESKTIIEAGLDRLLSRVRTEVDNLIGGSSRVLVSPEGRVTVGYTYSDEDSDSRLKRLKSQDFSILRPDGFSSLIQSLKSQVAEGNLIPVIEFLRANAKIEMPFVYPSTSPVREVERPREAPASSEWKLSDFLPALPPHPPLPKGLFKD